MDEATLALTLAPSKMSGFWQAQMIWQLGATASKKTVGILGAHPTCQFLQTSAP